MILVWDTCALNSVCRAIADHLKYTADPEVPLGTQGQDFLQILGEIMSELQTRCGHTNYTSDLVFAQEIDPTTPGSMLRYEHELLESFCGQDSFMGHWLNTLDQNIATEAITDQEIEELRPSVQPDPGRRDISLVVAALRLSNQLAEDCVIVTDDAPLIDRVNELRRAHATVLLSGQQYSTTRLTAELSLKVLRDLYVKCGTDHQFWQSAMFSFNIHYTAQEHSPEQKQYQSVVAFFGRFHSDRKEKELTAAMAEFGEQFGAQNG